MKMFEDVCKYKDIYVEQYIVYMFLLELEKWYPLKASKEFPLFVESLIG